MTGRQFTIRSASQPYREREVMVLALIEPMALRKATKVELRKAGARFVDQVSGSYSKTLQHSSWILSAEGSSSYDTGSAGPKSISRVFWR